LQWQDFRVFSVNKKFLLKIIIVAEKYSEIVAKGYTDEMIISGIIIFYLPQ
jgi:hypothetical protein